VLTVDLLRHGELEGGIKYRGTTDDPLTAFGRQQMEAVWKKIAPEIDHILTSPRSRCAGPAHEWANQRGIGITVDEDIAELDYGRWEGLSMEEIEAKYPGILQRWRTNPVGMRPPGGESIEELADRIARCRRRFCQEHDGRHLLLVAHSGSLRMLIAGLLAAPLVATRRLSMPYGCWSRIVCDAQEGEILFLNRQP